MDSFLYETGESAQITKNRRGSNRAEDVVQRCNVEANGLGIISCGNECRSEMTKNERRPAFPVDK